MPELHSKKSNHLLLQASIVIFIFLLGAKILNFFKKILIGHLFGVSSVADAFFAASYVPYYVAVFFEGVVFLVFLPLFSEIKTQKGDREAGQFAGQIFFILLALTGGIVLFSWGMAPWMMNELVPGFTLEEQALTVSLFRMMSWLVMFISLCSFFRALNSYFEKYAVAASSGFLDTAVMILITLMTWKLWGVYGAAWGSVIGAALAFAIQLLYLFPFFRIRITFAGFRWDWLRKVLVFFIPLAVIWAFQQIPLILINRFGSGMWEGTISALVIAQTLTTVPMGLVSHTVLLSVFPSLTKQWRSDAQDRASVMFFETLRIAFFVLIPLGFLISALGRPLAVFFFGNGEVNAESTERIGNALGCFGWGIFALYADLFMTQSLIAVRRVAPAVILCASRALLTYAFAYFLSGVWDYMGLALSFSLALAFNLFFLFPLFLQGTPFRGEWHKTWIYSGKLFLASVPAIIAGWVIFTGPVQTWFELSRVLLLAVSVFLALVLTGFYIFILSLLRVEEVQSLFDKAKRKWQERGLFVARPEDEVSTIV